MTDENEKSISSSGEQTGETAPDQPIEESPESAVTPGEDARKAYPRQVEAALDYAASNKYDYGPRLRKLDLEYTVESASPMTDDITRVVLSYRPAKFKGVSGSEYLDVDAAGVVQARRQIRPIKESKPWVLIGLAVLSVIAAAVLVPLMFTLEDTGDPLYVRGRTLFVRSSEPKLQQFVTYDAIDGDGVPRKWIILAEGTGTEIALVTITLINQTSGSVTLAIDSDAAQLTTEDDITVTPIDIFERVQWVLEGEESDPRLNVSNRPLWGDRVLLSGEQISGFMAFEVPAGSDFKTLRWSATDVANIRY